MRNITQIWVSREFAERLKVEAKKWKFPTYADFTRSLAKKNEFFNPSENTEKRRKGGHIDFKF